MADKDPRLARAGVSGFNKPKGTPSHPKKSHIVVAKDGDKVKTIRFGEQGASTAGDPKKGRRLIASWLALSFALPARMPRLDLVLDPEPLEPPAVAVAFAFQFLQ